MSRPFSILALLTLLAPAGAAAQQSGAVTTVPPLTASDPIRVVMRGSRRGFSGRFIAIDSTELRWLRSAETEVVLETALDRVARIDRQVDDADRSRGFWIGAGVGAGLSLLGGLMLQAAPSEGGANMG